MESLSADVLRLVFAFVPEYFLILTSVSKNWLAIVKPKLDKHLPEARAEANATDNLMERLAVARISGKYNPLKFRAPEKYHSEKLSRQFYLRANDFLGRSDFAQLGIEFRFTSGTPQQRTFPDPENEDIFLSMANGETPYMKAVKHGAFRVFRFYVEQDKLEKWDYYPSIYCAKYGRLDILKWIVASKLQFPENLQYSPFLPAHAAYAANLEMLHWLRSSVNGLVWNKNTFSYATRSNDMNILRWIHGENIGQFDSADICIGAAQRGNIEMLTWLRSLNPPCPWNDIMLCRAIQANRPEVVKWALSQNPPCPWSQYQIYFAVEAGMFDLVKWLHERNCPGWDAELCVYAARGRNMEILRWLRSQNPPCPWDTKATQKACKNVNTEMFRYMLESDPPCPIDWSSLTELIYATKKNPEEALEILQVLREHRPDVLKEFAQSPSFTMFTKIPPAWQEYFPGQK